MKCRIVIDPAHEEEVIIYAHERSERIKEIEKFVTGMPAPLYGIDGTELVRLNADEIIRFVIEDGHLMAVCGNRRYRMRERLFEIEDGLAEGFVKINQSCIARIKAMVRFEATVGGSLKVLFRNGEWDYVSRRQLKAVKERLGLK